MPSFTIHGVLPLLLLLAVRRLDARKVWALWPLTLVPDVDYFFPGHVHRAATGNVFVLLPFVAVLLWAWRPWRPADRRAELAEWMGIASVYLASHLVMDAFTGGTVLFYPLSDYNYCYAAGIDVLTATNTLEPYFEACGAPGIPTVAERYPWLSGTDAAMLAFVLPAGLVGAAVGAVRYARARRAA